MMESSHRSGVEVLLAAARSQIDSAGQCRLRAAVPDVGDWGPVLALAAGQRVLPLVVHSLITHCLDQLPTELQGQLRSLGRTTAVNNLYLAQALVLVLDLLRGADVEAIPFKGPVLAQDGFGGLHLRSFGDLDVLVAEGDLGRAITCLMSAGFRGLIDLDAAGLRALALAGHHAVLHDPRRGVTVEVHWEMSGRYTAQPMTLALVAGEIRRTHLLERPVATLSPELLLVFLCVHGGREYWRDLGHVASVAEHLRHSPNLNWHVVQGWAQRLRMVGQLRLGLTLAQTLLGVPSAAVAELPGMDARFVRLAASIGRELPGQRSLQGLTLDSLGAFIAYHGIAMDRWRDSVRFSVHSVLATTYADWQWFPLPPNLAFLYPWFRPWRLVWKYAAGMLTRRDAGS